MQLCHVMKPNKDVALIARMVWQLYLQGTQMVLQRLYNLLCYHVDIASNHCNPCAKSKKRMDDHQFARWYERHNPECYKTHGDMAGHNRQM